MSRVPGGRRVLAGLLASSLLMALAVLPASPFHSSVAASGETSDCSASQGGPTSGSDFYQCQLRVEFPPQPGLICGEGCFLEVPAGSDFTTTVRVLASDGFTQITTDTCGAVVPITLTLWENGGGFAPLLPGESVTETAVGGEATFHFAVANPGSYYLQADVTDETCANTFNSGFSDNISVTEGGTVVVPCELDVTCIADVPPAPNGTTAKIDAGTGGGVITAFFSALGDAGPDGTGFTNCKGTSVGATDVLTFDVVGGTQPKTITVVYPRTPMLKICWHTDTTFKQKDGKMAKADPLGGFTGLLPNCKKMNPVGPCILSIKTPRGGTTTTVKVLAPVGDPSMKK